MPQMAPLNWLILFLYFCFILYLFNLMNFFNFHYQINSLITVKKSIAYNWKW